MHNGLKRRTQTFSRGISLGVNNINIIAGIYALQNGCIQNIAIFVDIHIARFLCQARSFFHGFRCQAFSMTVSVKLVLMHSDGGLGAVVEFHEPLISNELLGE